MKLLVSFLSNLFLLVGLFLTIWGLAHLDWSKDFPFSNNEAFIRYIGVIFSATFLVFCGSYFFRINAILVGTLIAFSFTILTGYLWSLITVICFFVASVLLGQWVIKKLSQNTDEQSLLTCLMVGSGVYGSAIGLFSCFPINYPGLYGFLLVLPIIINRGVLQTYLRNFSITNNHSNFSINWLEIGISVVLLFYFVIAFLPEVGHDALAMHLFVPAFMAVNHQWSFDVSTYVWAVMPMLGDWIYAIVYLLADEVAVRLVNFGFIIILGLLLRDLVRWAGGSDTSAKWALLIFLSTPLTFTEGSSLFIESIWATFVISGLLAILRFCSNNEDSKSLPVIGLFLGCALSAKAVTFTILPVFLIYILWQYKVWLKNINFKHLIIGLSVLFLIGSVPYFFAFYITGNPVFPFFNAIFKSSYYPSVNFDGSAFFGKGVSWNILYSVTFESIKFLEATNGVSGFQWLIFLIPTIFLLICKLHRKALALVTIGLYIVFVVFQSVSYLRYILPGFVVLIAAIGLFRDELIKNNNVLNKIWNVMFAVVVGLNLFFIGSGSFYKDFPLTPIIDAFNRNHYLSDRLPIRNAVLFVNQLNNYNNPVAVFASPMTAGLSADPLYPNWYNSNFQTEVSSANSDQELADILNDRSVTFIIIDSNWTGQGCCDKGEEKKLFILKISDKIADFGSISVRKVNNNFKFKTELLHNADLNEINSWSLMPGAEYLSDQKVILASVQSPVTQMVKVTGGHNYLNTVVQRCSNEHTIGRIQVNWLDISGSFINTDIVTYDCSMDWAERTMEVVSPENAITAVVYATGHTSVPLEFKHISFRR
jgi:hypothetical protein